MLQSRRGFIIHYICARCFVPSWSSCKDTHLIVLAPQVFIKCLKKQCCSCLQNSAEVASHRGTYQKVLPGSMMGVKGRDRAAVHPHPCPVSSVISSKHGKNSPGSCQPHVRSCSIRACMYQNPCASPQRCAEPCRSVLATEGLYLAFGLLYSRVTAKASLAVMLTTSLLSVFLLTVPGSSTTFPGRCSHSLRTFTCH